MCGFDIITITETWLQSDIFDAELFPESFIVFRSDRQLDRVATTRRGGVLVAVRSKMEPERINLVDITDTTPVIDLVGCKITVSYFVFYLIVIYAPPTTSVNDLETVCEAIASINLFMSGRLVVVGDFNVPSYHSQVSNNKSRILTTL